MPASLFTALPQGERLLRAFLAYDVVGLQTEGHRHDFLDSVKQVLGLEADAGGLIATANNKCRAIADPIGIDARGFAATASRAERSPETRRLLSSLVGRALVIGVDRLDYSKGLPHRFTAFGKLLADFPAYRQKVSYLQVAAKSREDVGEYQALRRELDRKAGNVNGRFAEFDWVPLRYMTRPMSRTTLAGFYRAARVGLVTPLCDGMNLVAKEFVAAQDQVDPGVLILSRFAGAAEELTDALIVNLLAADTMLRYQRDPAHLRAEVMAHPRARDGAPCRTRGPGA